MNDDRAKEVINEQSQMEAHRAVFDSHYKEIAERILPRQDDFMTSRSMEGEKRTDKIFDSTAVLALDRAASAIDSLITPATQRYHQLAPEDESLIDDHSVRMFLDQINNALFRMRYRPAANFASQAHECYISLMAFGTDSLFIDDVIGMGVRYKACPMSEIYIAENHSGIIDMVHRKFPMTARAAAQKWGDKLPPSILKAAEKSPLIKFDFIHCVKPNKDIKSKRKDYRGMPLSSYYVSVEGSHMLSEGGYRTMPYAIGRHVTAPRETYGRSPAMQVLPDIKMVNEMEKTMIRAAHKLVDPPLLLYGDGILNAFNARPNALNYGGVDEQGRQLVVPLKTGSNLPIGLEMAEQKRKLINDAFYITLFQILVENPRMTATEALIRAQEKGQLLAPTVSRQQEWLSTIIDRELDIMMTHGIPIEVPQKLIDAGGGIKVEHTSPLNRLRRAEDGVAIVRTIESLIPLANINPEVLDVFDDDAIAREMAEINGVPEKIMRTVEIVEDIREQRRQAAQAQAEAELADTAANAGRNATVAMKNLNEMTPAGGVQ